MSVERYRETCSTEWREVTTFCMKVGLIISAVNSVVSRVREKCRVQKNVKHDNIMNSGK